MIRSRGLTLWDNGEFTAHSKQRIDNPTIWQNTLTPFNSSMSTSIQDTDLIFIQKGTACVQHNDEKEIVPAGSLIIMPSGERCIIEADVGDKKREDEGVDSIEAVLVTIVRWPFSPK